MGGYLASGGEEIVICETDEAGAIADAVDAYLH